MQTKIWISPGPLLRQTNASSRLLKTGVFGVEVEMQLFTLSITDLTTFESVPHEEWAEKEDLFAIGNRFARAMLAANPDFRHRGMCVAIYDEAGVAVSMMPLDTLQ